jgi:hypothetical protein
MPGKDEEILENGGRARAIGSGVTVAGLRRRHVAKMGERATAAQAH